MSLAAYSHYPDYIVTSPSVYIVVVLINRPSHLNTFTDRMWHHLGTLFAQLSHDDSVRAVVLAGCGDNLTAGLDMHEASQGDILNGMEEGVDGARKAVRLMRYIEKFQACVSAVEKCEKRKFSLDLICTLDAVTIIVQICRATDSSIKATNISIRIRSCHLRSSWHILRHWHRHCLLRRYPPLHDLDTLLCQRSRHRHRRRSRHALSPAKSRWQFRLGQRRVHERTAILSRRGFGGWIRK